METLDSKLEQLERQTALNNLLLDSLKEQRRRRRWGIFFKLIYLVVIVWIVMLLSMDDSSDTNGLGEEHIGLIDVDGPIFAGAKNSADNIVTGLSHAFKNNASGIILRINSPGGSPVQADYVFDAIVRLKSQYPNKKVIAVCSDICASGAYYIAAAADEIYVNPSSLVGSIGVILNGFGFVDTLEKLGVTRRLIISGDNKAFLDPFSPLDPQQEQHAQMMLNEVHQEFINRVKEGRGKRLEVQADTFSGLIWTGKQAVNMGLADGFASAGTVAREQFKTESIVNYTVEPGYFERFANSFGASVTTQFAKVLGLEQAPLQ